jgi:hypothetical protein
MTGVTQIRDRMTGAARRQQDRYAGDADRPLRGYVTTMTVYTGLVGLIAGGIRVAGRQPPDRLDLVDIALSAVATHKLSRLLSRDSVTSPLRAPFTTYRGPAGPAELSEDVRGEGARKAVGELITCPFCIGVWIATAVTAGLIYLPRTTRLVTGTLTALAGADVLHYAHALLDKAAE